MPDLDRFLQGFHIYKGLVLDGYTLTNINATEKEIVRYRQYAYPLLLTFSFTANHGQTNLLLSLKQHVKANRIIYTEYGNPYQCSFGAPIVVKKIGNTVLIKTMARAKRILKG